MTYDWLESVPSSVTSIPTYVPDFSFLQSMQMRANQQYEQGLSKVANEYALFNKPVTNFENKQAQRDHARQAQEQMKSISAADLSDPKNVAIAENILTPFINDQDILYDQSMTAYIGSQMQTADSDATSKDEKIRASYNPYSVNKLRWVLNDLRDAKRGDGSIQRIEKRSYVPQIDVNGYVDAADKAEGFKGVDFETPDGKAGIIKEHDGIKAIPNFKTRLNALLDAKFNPQFSDQGYDWYRKEKAAVLRDNPGMSEDAVKAELGKRRFDDLSRIYQNKIVSLQDDIKAKFDDPIAMLRTAINSQGGKATPEQQMSISKLSKQKQDYNSAVSIAQDDYNDFVKNPQRVISDVQRNPEDYYTRQIRETTVNNMATGRAMGDYSYTLDVNKAWQALDQSDNWRTSASLRSMELEESIRKTNIEHQDKHEKNLLDAGYTYSASGSLVAPASNTMTDMHYAGENTTGPQHTTFSQQLQQEKDVNFNTVVDNTFSANGVAGALMMSEKEGGTGVSLGTLTDFNTMYKRLYSPENRNNPDFRQTPQEKQAFIDVFHKLQSALGADKVPYTYAGVRDALYTYVANQNAKRVATGTFTSTNDLLANAFAASEISKDALNNYTSMDQQEHDWINHLATGDKDKYKPLLNDAGTGLATVGDVAKHAPTLSVTDSKRNRTTISSLEYANAYLNRKVDYLDPQTVKINDRLYTIEKVNGQPNIKLSPDAPYQYTEYPSIGAATAVTNRFGLYEERDRLNKSLAENAASNLKFVKDKTGKIGGNFTYDFGNEKVTGRGERLISETMFPSNTLKWYDDKGNDITSDDNFKTILRDRGSSYSDIRKNMGNPIHSTVSEYGAPTTTFTIKGYTDENGKTHDAKTVTAVHSPDAKGEIISRTPQNTGVYIYQKLLSGQSITSDDMSNSCGFKYELQPDDRLSPKNVNISITRKMYNPNTKRIEDYSYPVRTYPLSSGIDNIMTELRAMQVRSIRDLAAEQKQYNLQNAR